MYIETSSNNHGINVFVSFQRTDTIQISNITFFYDRFSDLTNNSLKSMGRFRIQLILKDITWSTRYNIAKNDRYSVLQLNGLWLIYILLLTINVLD